LFEKSRPGHALVLGPGQAQRIVAMICGPPPPGQARWSVRLIAATAMQRHRWPASGERPSGCC
jgi:hypothetical protein